MLIVPEAGLVFCPARLVILDFHTILEWFLSQSVGLSPSLGFRDHTSAIKTPGTGPILNWFTFPKKFV